MTTTTPSNDAIKAFDAGNDAYEILAPYARTGALSYIARMDGITFVIFDTSLRTYEGASGALDGWEHKTGGMVTDEMLKWAIDETRADVDAGRPIVAVSHQNFLPHFEMEDKILKDFTLFNWEKVTYTLADAGIKYGLSGHMHSFDIANYVTQNGNVFFDFETGSPISYASGSRILEFTYSKQGDIYTENVYSTVLPNDVSLTYHIPYYNSATGLIEQQEKTLDNLLDHLDAMQSDMLPNLLEGYLDEDFIVGMLTGMLEGLKGMAGLGNTLYDLAVSLVNQLLALDLERPTFSNGYNAGSTYTFDGVPDEGYNIFDLVKDLAQWAINQDMTFGLSDNPVTLSDTAAHIYKMHISGADPSELSPDMQNLVAQCENGRVVDFLFTTLIDFLFPQIDIITSAPLRTSTESPALTPGTGFDLATEIDNMKKKNRIIGTVIAGFLTGDNLFELVQSLLPNIPTVLDLLGKSLGSLDSVLGYAANIASYDSFTDFIDGEVLQKYVTNALKVNLGCYVKLIIAGWAADATPDGASIDPNAERGWNVINEPRFHVVYSEDSFGGNTYRIDSTVANSGSLDVVSSIGNGLLPSMLSVTFGDEIATSKEFKWFTKIQTDIYNPDIVPASVLKYWTADDQSDAVSINAVSANVLREIPLIDLGITYLTKAIHTFNMHTVSLTDLTPKTSYYYKVGSDTYGWSDTYVFKTGAASGDSFTILGITDIQGSVEENYIESLLALRVALSVVKNPAFIISGGDNVDKGSSTYQWKWLLDGQREVWANNTLVTVAGNHEEKGFSIESFVALPETIETDETGHYYSYDYLNTHFVIVNTNDLGSNNALSATQTAWLIDDLAAAKTNPDIKWTIVTLHKGLYTAGSHAFDPDVIALRAQLTSIFVEGGVDLVLQGHDHTYSMSKFIGADGLPTEITYDDRGAAINPSGIPYINLGTIGDKFYNYIYHDDVYLVDRNAQDYASGPLSTYFKNGNLELTETPAFMELTIDDNNIFATTYTIVDGAAVLVDRLIISDTAVIIEQPIPDDGLSGGEIAAIVCGSIVGTAGIGFAIFWFIVRKKKYVA